MGSRSQASLGTGGLNSAAQLEKAREALTGMICTADFPPHSVVDGAFKDLTQSLNPFFDVGDFDSIKAGCLKFYERDAIRIKDALADVDAKMNLSVETFQSETWDSYVCLTAHFLDEDWKLRKWVLMFEVLHYKTLAEDIWKCLEHWGISGKAASLALKSYRLDEETVKEIKDLMQERSQVLVGGKLFHVQCCAQLLTKMAQKAVNGVPSDIMDNLRMLYSWGRFEPMWHITHGKLNEGLELLEMGEFDTYPGYKEYLPSAEEWEKVEGITKLVDMVEAVTETLFHAKHPSASLYLTNLHVLHKSLMEKECSSFANPIREKMLKYFNTYWDNMFPTLAVAAVMDPRCKMAYIEYLSSKVPENSTKPSSVLEIVRTLYDSYLANAPSHEASESDSNPSDCESDDFGSEDEEMKTDNAESVVAEKEGSNNCVNVGVKSILKDYQQYVEASKQPARSELDLYLEEPVVAWDEEFKLVKWWKRQSPKYPVLSRLARDLLAIPFMVTTSYDGYYSNDRYVDTHMLSSEPDMMNVLSCTRSWNRKA